MPHNNKSLAGLLDSIDLGSPVAELDNLLETARVETSVFADILHDRVDLVPGTKGSGKSALYRIFVDFLPEALLSQRKVVVAHGVRTARDELFHAFKDRFGRLNENQFLDFWCVYLVSLADEHFVRNPVHSERLATCGGEVQAFRDACRVAKIPALGQRKPIREVIDWALTAVLSRINPRATYRPDSNTWQFELLQPVPPQAVKRPHPTSESPLPGYVGQVVEELERLLEKADLHLWLMVDRLDELFPRRTPLETRALRGLLRTLQVFQTPRVRVKVFLRDDILEQITVGSSGFTALTHVTARRADRLQWSEDQILDLVVNRLFASNELCQYLQIDRDQLRASRAYRSEAFYKVFPETVHRGEKQSKTLRWIYNHTMDGRGVVTPRDVIELLTRAKQKQHDEYEGDPTAQSEHIISPAALQYGLKELSVYKRDTLLKAEFPHFWPQIEKFCNGKAEYTEAALQALLGSNWRSTMDDLLAIGVLAEQVGQKRRTFKIPFVYREGLGVTQGRKDSEM